MNRLLLMCGIHKREGWTTLDGDPNHHPDILAWLPPLPPSVVTQKWDEIEWIHGITSVYPWEAAELLAELRGSLALGGKLVLEQPDARKSIAAVCKDFTQLPWLFGDPGLREAKHMNKWAYTPDTLYTALRAAGFHRVVATTARHHVIERDFRMEAWVL